LISRQKLHEIMIHKNKKQNTNIFCIIASLIIITNIYYVGIAITNLQFKIHQQKICANIGQSNQKNKTNGVK